MLISLQINLDLSVDCRFENKCGIANGRLSLLDYSKLKVVLWSLCLNTASELYWYKFDHSLTKIKCACVNGAILTTLVTTSRYNYGVPHSFFKMTSGNFTYSRPHMSVNADRLKLDCRPKEVLKRYIVSLASLYRNY